MTAVPLEYTVVFLLIAFFYSMAGFGGGSSYAAVLLLLGIPHFVVPQLALMCNLVVASLGFSAYARKGHFNLKRALPLILGSIPAAFIGAMISISKEVFCILLGCSLWVASLRLLMGNIQCEELKPFSAQMRFGVGTVLGLLSGITGIGGGIFLSPLLVLKGFARLKEASAMAAFFIIANSIAGLAGQSIKSGWMRTEEAYVLLFAVLVGGFLGSRMGAVHLPRVVLQRVLAVLILFVSSRILGGM